MSDRNIDEEAAVKEVIERIIISDQEFDALLDLCTNMVVDIGTGKTSIPPTVFIAMNSDSKDRKVVSEAMGLPLDQLNDMYKEVGGRILAGVFPTDVDFSDADEKFGFFFDLGKNFKGHPVSIFMISEAWMSRLKVGEEMKNRPSQDPNRIEVLMVAGLTLDGRAKGIPMEMIRDEMKRISFKPLGFEEEEKKAKEAGGDGKITIRSYLLEEFWKGYMTGLQKRIQDAAKQN